MLHVVTARGTLTWAFWRTSLSSLASAKGLSHELSPAEALRILDCLGHIEVTTSPQGVAIAAAPAFLAKLPRAGLPRAVLCGGRSPETERRLAEAAAGNGCRFTPIFSSLQNESPRPLLIEADGPGTLPKLADAIGVAYSETPPAWTLAHVSGTVPDYTQTLQWASEPEPPLPARELDPATLRFTDPVPTRSGPRIIQYFPRRLPPYHVLRDGQNFARVDRDWGIYAALSGQGRNVIIHDHQAYIVAAPATAPLPRLLARTLALCSGLPPAWLAAADAGWPTSESRGYWVYSQIPASIASLALNKLDQQSLPLQIPHEFLRRIQSQTPS
jgi:hypothetical protein